MTHRYDDEHRGPGVPDAIGLDDRFQTLTPFRIVGALYGNSLMSLDETYRQIVAFLRSNEPIDPEVRCAFADAIQRGQDNEDGVRLKIEAHGKHFKQIASRNSYRSLLEAAAYIVTERSSGKRFTSIYAELPSKFLHITDGEDFGKRARELFTEFSKFAKSNDPFVVHLVGECPHNFATQPLANDDYFVLTAMRFCERKSGMIES